MERFGALVATLSLAACADILGFEEGQSPPPNEAASSSASSSQSAASGGGFGGQGGEGGEPGAAGSAGAATPVTRIAFVSASPIAVNPESGMAAFDEFCMTQAAAHFPTKQFVAWVSRNGGPGVQHVDAQDRIVDAEWYRPDGVLIADDKNDLLDGTLDNPINVKANSESIGAVVVWTGTLEGGNDSTHDCNNWLTTDPATSSAMLGVSNATDKDWTHHLVGECNESHHVYCFEE